MANNLSRRLRSFLALLPLPLWSFYHESLFDCGRRYADVANFAVDDGFDALKIREETALGDGSYVRADTAAFLGFTTAPDDAALHGAFAGQFTNSCHNNPISIQKGRGK